VLEVGGKMKSRLIAAVCVSLFMVSCASITQSVKEGDLESVKKIIEGGADVNAKGDDTFHSPALLTAAEKGNAQIVAYLISKGANVNAYNDIGFTALVYVARDSKDTKIAQMLVDAGANINWNHAFMKTPLMWAAEYGRKDMVKYLLSKKADVNIRTKYGKTALDYGQFDAEISKMLVDAGAVK